MASDAARLVDRALAGATAGYDDEAIGRIAGAALDSGREADVLPLVERAAKARANPVLWQWAALLHRALDRHAEAIDAFGAAARLAHGDARIAHGLARTAMEAGLPAAAAFERARALAPQDGEVVLGHTAALLAERGIDAATRALAPVLAASPGWAEGHETLARLHWIAGDRSGFTAPIERALAARPRDPVLWRTLLVLLLQADRYEEVLVASDRARRAIGDHSVVDANVAVALSELRRDAEADTAFARVAGIDDPVLAVRHGRHLLRTGRLAEASACFEGLLSGPAAALAWPYVATLWRMRDDPRAAWLEGQEGLVGVYDLAAELPALDRLAEVLRGLHRSVHQPLDQSLRGGTQTDGALFQRLDPEIRALRAVIERTVARHIEALPPVDPAHPQLGLRRTAPPRFAGSWSVRLTDAGFHANHNHPAGWFSSAFYIVLPEEEGAAGHLALGAPQAELALDLPPVRTIAPAPGRLILFPSTMWHGTIPFARGERLTVAFDVARPFA